MYLYFTSQIDLSVTNYCYTPGFTAAFTRLLMENDTVQHNVLSSGDNTFTLDIFGVLWNSQRFSYDYRTETEARYYSNVNYGPPGMRCEIQICDANYSCGGSLQLTLYALCPNAPSAQYYYSPVKSRQPEYSGQGGRPETGINYCLHFRYSEITRSLGCDPYWIDTTCIPNDHQLHAESIAEINKIFLDAKVMLIWDRDIIEIDISNMTPSVCEVLVAKGGFPIGLPRQPIVHNSTFPTVLALSTPNSAPSCLPRFPLYRGLIP